MGQALRRQGNVGSNLTEGPILRTLLTFSIPIVLSSVIQQLYSLVDVMVIGMFVGSTGTVGVNTGGEIADLVMPVAFGISSAGQIYIAQLTGSRNYQRIKETVGTLLVFMLLASAALGVVTILFSREFLQMLNCPVEAMEQAQSYMVITALGFPFIFGYNAVVSILRGMGESKQPLYFIIIAALVNVVLDLLLVAVFKLEAAGTAIATAASQFGAFAAAAIFLWKKRDKLGFTLDLSCFKIHRDVLWVLLRLGIPQVVRSTLVRFGMLWVNAEANAFGLVVSATNSVGNKLLKFLDVFSQGVDAAAASMIGQNLGARKFDRAGKVPLYTLGATMVCATVASALCLLVPKQIYGLFSDDPAVLELGTVFLRIMVAHFYVSSVVGAFQAMVTGSGFVTLGFAIGVLDGLVFKIGLSLLFMEVFGMGYLGLFWGSACSRILPALMCAVYYFSGKWKTRKLLSDE